MNNYNDMLSINFKIEEDDNEEESKKIIEKMEKLLLKEKQKSKGISKISTNTEFEKNYTSIKEEFQNWYEYATKTKKVTKGTFDEYKTSFKYLFMFYGEDSKIYELMDIKKWLEYRDLLQSLPNTTLRRFNGKKPLNEVIDTIIEENEVKDKETTLLNAKTINKHFQSYSMFLDYLQLQQKINFNPIEKLKPLITTENPYNSYTDEEIIKLFSIADKEIKNFFKLSIYSGLRLSPMINIKKENIDLESKLLTVREDKSLAGNRKITIHNDLIVMFQEFKQSEREHLFFNTNSKDKVNKHINPLIKKLLEVNKSIHGFRKNFAIQVFKHTTDINLRKYILGHSQLHDITFTTYNEENIDVKEMSKSINLIEYKLKENKITSLGGF